MSKYKNKRARAKRVAKYKALVEELTRWRIENGLSRIAVSRKLGLKQEQSLWGWEHGRCVPLPKTAFRMAKLIGKKMSIQEFCEWQNEADEK